MGGFSQNYFDFLVENYQSWDYSDPNDRSGASQGHQGGKYVLQVQDDLALKVAQLTKQLEKLQTEKSTPVASVAWSDELCCLCDIIGHAPNQYSCFAAFQDLTAEHEHVADVNSMNNFSTNAPLSGGYTPNWCNHPRLSWGNQNSQNQGPSNFQNQGKNQQTPFHYNNKNAWYQGPNGGNQR